MFAPANWNPGGHGGVYHNHLIGVKFAPGHTKWSVFNENGVYMPTDPAFNVLIPVPDAGVFVHKATTANTTEYYTYLNHPHRHAHAHPHPASSLSLVLRTV